MKDLFNDLPIANKLEDTQQPKISGYRIYAPEQKKRTVVNNLPEFYPELPEEKYDIIYCDPPYRGTAEYSDVNNAYRPARYSRA